MAATVTFDNVFHDCSGVHGTTSNTERVNALKPGVHQAVASTYPVANTAGRRQVRVRKVSEATDNIVGYMNIPAAASGGTCLAFTTTPIECAAGDCFYVQAWRDSGGSLYVNRAAEYSPLPGVQQVG